MRRQESLGHGLTERLRDFKQIDLCLFRKVVIVSDYFYSDGEFFPELSLRNKMAMGIG